MVLAAAAVAARVAAAAAACCCFRILPEMQHRQLEPDVMSFNAACSACEKRQQWQQSLGMLSEMEYQHLEPNVISFNAAISACEKGNQWQQALGMLLSKPPRRLRRGENPWWPSKAACRGQQQHPAAASIST